MVSWVLRCLMWGLQTREKGQTKRIAGRILQYSHNLQCNISCESALPVFEAPVHLHHLDHLDHLIGRKKGTALQDRLYFMCEKELGELRLYHVYTQTISCET